MQTIAESELSTSTVWKPNRSHDLADITAAAAEPAASRHPTRWAGGVGAELEWSRVDGRGLTKRGGNLGCGGVEHTDAERCALNLCGATVAARGTILDDDRWDADAVHFHSPLIVPEPAAPWRAVRGGRRLDPQPSMGRPAGSPHNRREGRTLCP